VVEFNKIVTIPTGGGNPAAPGPGDSVVLNIASLTVAGRHIIRDFQQALTGPQDGFNTVFTTSSYFIPSGPSKESFYLNGVLLRQGVTEDYTVSESGGVGTGFDTITMAFAPRSNDWLAIDYCPDT
jgi:hypothetical protein